MRISIAAILILTALATHVFAEPGPLPAPDLSTLDFRQGADPVPTPDVIGLGPGGKIYVGGSFDSVAGQPRPGVARLDPDGSLDSAWNPVLPAGLSPPRIAAEDAAGNVALVHRASQDLEPLVFLPAGTLQGSVVTTAGPNGFFTSLRFEGTALYAVFSDFALARYIGGTTVDPAFQLGLGYMSGCIGFNPELGKINDFLVHDGFVYVAWSRGLFRVAVADAKYDAQWQPIPNGYSPPFTGQNAQGAQITPKVPCTPPTYTYTQALAASPDGWIYAQGLLENTPYGVTPRPGIRRFSATGTGAADGSWSVAASAVDRMVLQSADGHLYAAGLFQALGGFDRAGIAAISTAPGAAVVAGWDPSVPMGTHAPTRIDLVLLGDRVLMSGPFTSVGGTPRMNVAAIPLASGPVTWPAMSIDTHFLDFGLAATATQRSRVATIRNDGGADLVVGGIAFPAGIGTLTNGCQAPIPPGGTCELTVEANIGPETQFDSTLTIESNGGAPRAVTLRAGLGDAYTYFGIVSISYPVVLVGDAGSSTGSVTNTSGAALALGRAFFRPLPGHADRTAEFSASNECEGVLAAGATCTFHVTFTPVTYGQAYVALSFDASTSGHSQGPFQFSPSTNYVAVSAIGGLSADDYDGDGMPNALEQSQGLDPLVKDNDVFAATPAGTRRFAMQQYRDFLNREGDAGGVDFWSGQVSNGAMSRASVIENFFGSQEFQGTIAPVTRLYFAYFLRIPDYPGLNFWIGYFRAGNTIDAISNNFAASAEFQNTYGSLDNGQFVNLVYQNVLGRPADAGGLAFWKNELDTGARTRGQVMLGFSESEEYRGSSDSMVYVTMMYVGMLRRAPEQQGFDFWVGYRNAGNSGLALIDAFLGSQEYRGRFLP